MKYPEIKKLPNNPSLKGLARFVSGVIYAKRGELDLQMQLLVPWSVEDPAVTTARHPLIVFCQGSAWTTPDFTYEIPQLSQYAQAGYVVATVGHRDSTQGHRSPAFLQDVKAAIRYLRAHADTYHIDPERVAMWGTSSGGNTALLVGLTGDDPAFLTEDFPEYGDSVKTVVECFGPSDMIGLLDRVKERIETGDEGTAAIFHGLFGQEDAEQKRRAGQVSPLHLVEDGKPYPPFLIIHGDQDDVVAYDHSVRMFHRLCDAGVSAEMICIEGAPHEGNFWSQELHGMVLAYLRKTL